MEGIYCYGRNVCYSIGLTATYITLQTFKTLALFTSLVVFVIVFFPAYVQHGLASPGRGGSGLGRKSVISKEVKSARPPSAQGPHFKTSYVEQMPHKPTQGQPPNTAEKVDVVWSWVVWT